MHWKTDQVHIRDHFYLSQCTVIYKQQAPNITLPRCDAITGKTVFVYPVHAYNEQERRKNTALLFPRTELNVASI